MDTPQTPNNQNNSGISGFGSIPVNNVPTGTPTPPAQPAVQGFPEAKPAMPAEPVSSDPMTSMPASPMPAQSISTAPVKPMAEPASIPSNPFSSPDPTPAGNLANQTLVGGVEENQDKHKKFSFSSVTSGPQTGSTMQAPPSTGTNAYNEVTAPASRNKFAMIAIIAGIALLVLAGGGYYYLTMMKPAETPEQPEPVVEQPQEQPVVETSPIDIDPYIMEMTQREATSTPETMSLNEHIRSIDFTNIDNELQTSAGEAQTVPTGAEEPSNPIIETEPVPMP